jgi:hypothetical protein
VLVRIRPKLSLADACLKGLFSMSDFLIGVAFVVMLLLPAVVASFQRRNSEDREH